MITAGEALVVTVRTLHAAGVPSPEVDARWLVETTGSDPRRDPDHVLTATQRAVLDDLVARRAAREPLQLVLGTTVFRDVELRCRPGVFIPRPETEVLVDIALDLVRAASTHRSTPVVVHEPCCGTGAVGLALASAADGAVVEMSDRSPVAVALAVENRDALAASGRLRAPVGVHRGGLLDAFDAPGIPTADLVVANPPYLPRHELASLEPEVAAHDPHDALSGGADGHEVVDRLLGQAARRLRPGGAVVLEIDARRSAATVAVARRSGLVDVEVHDDLTGAPRFVVAHRPGSPGSDG